MSATARQVAGTTPRALLGQPRFWLRRPAFLASGIVAIGVVIGMWSFTYGAATGVDVVLIGFVHALGLWAAAIAIRSLAVLEVEHALASEIDRKGAELLREIRSGHRARIDLDLLEQAILPANPADPAPAMIRLVQHICKEAKDRKFESSVNVMQPYREEPLDAMFKLQNLQKIALWLGILGTFVGLLVAIAAADMRSSDFMAIVQRMFAGLVIAFSASLAGLQVAVFIGVLLLLIRGGHARYFKVMESAVVTMLSLARNSINKDELMTELGQVTSVIHDLNERVHAQTVETARNIEGTRREIVEQTNAIRDGMQHLGEARESFSGFLKNLSSSQTQFLDEVRSVYDTISLKNLSFTLHETLTQAGRLLSDTISIATRQIANRLTDFNSAVDQLTNTLDKQSSDSADYARTLANQIATTTNDSTSALKVMTARLQEMAMREQTIRSDLQELSRKVAMLSNSIDRLEYRLPVRPRRIRDLIALFRW